MGWADKEQFLPKINRLLAKIDKLSKQGHDVSLVGASAGASTVLIAYSQRQDVHAVVLIAGKVNNPETIDELTYKANPAFKESVFSVADSLRKLDIAKRRRIMSIHPLFDSTVPVIDTKIAGAVEKTIPVIGHRFSIFYTITFRGRLIANFIKKFPE